MSEFQKPFDETGRINAELITTKHFHKTSAGRKKWCFCRFCGGRRNRLKRKVNRLRGFKFYKDV